MAVDRTNYLTRGNIACNYHDIESYTNITTEHSESLFHHNSRSLNKNVNDITNFISSLEHDFSIIGFTETWFTTDIP